jgi:hypothetical protein
MAEGMMYNVIINLETGYLQAGKYNIVSCIDYF